MGVGLRFHRPVLLPPPISINIAHGKASVFLALLYGTLHRRELGGAVRKEGSAWAFSSCPEESQFGQDKPLELSRHSPRPGPCGMWRGNPDPAANLKPRPRATINLCRLEPLEGCWYRRCAGLGIREYAVVFHTESLSKRGARPLIRPGDGGYFWTNKTPQQEVSHV